MSDNRHHILVIEDDDRLLSLLVRFLSSRGYRATGAGSVEEARKRMTGTFFDAFVVDVMLPGETGLDFVRSLQDRPSGSPCLLLTAMGEPGERLFGLEIGADDYMTKPFEPDELALRIRNLLRRSGHGEGVSGEVPGSGSVAGHAGERSGDLSFGGEGFSADRVRFGPHEYDPSSGLLQTGNRRNALTGGERELLGCFASHANKVVSREMLSSMLTGRMEGRSLDVAVARLRRKLEPNPRKPIYLLTARGQGWMLQADSVPERNEPC